MRGMKCFSVRRSRWATWRQYLAGLTAIRDRLEAVQAHLRWYLSLLRIDTPLRWLR